MKLLPEGRPISIKVEATLVKKELIRKELLFIAINAVETNKKEKESVD